MNAYKGKKFSVVSPQNIFEVLGVLAKKEQRTISQMATMLIAEALTARGMTIDADKE
jgi:CopG-like RHH_1 or ribbon-helix-helix domain, RHH_5